MIEQDRISELDHAYRAVTEAFEKLKEPGVSVGYALDTLAGLMRRLEPHQTAAMSEWREEANVSNIYEFACRACLNVFHAGMGGGECARCGAPVEQVTARLLAPTLKERALEIEAAELADNERLRALIKTAESVECYCPWCRSVAVLVDLPRAWKHAADCPAFTPEGEVR